MSFAKNCNFTSKKSSDYEEQQTKTQVIILLIEKCIASIKNMINSSHDNNPYCNECLESCCETFWSRAFESSRSNCSRFCSRCTDIVTVIMCVVLAAIAVCAAYFCFKYGYLNTGTGSIDDAKFALGLFGLGAVSILAAGALCIEALKVLCQSKFLG